ncbi:carbohydrate kinase family protein [Methylobacterium haplocladii]|uniref:Fructokinase n=1 Tax=Methylobacterium haplocladii TaxID=1176176 RepID=A0A512IVA1_9HYPH|nr:carbohydrate kinase [Methylobacterium haplocladii]GEP01623.1 fructokinase [Methylobacterium haplocladii]GJD85941.1 Fructokinase [Methylobacterium haplocladii]GLS59952.1 fructokinase [Methylobacterium haplocladii]
MILVSGEALIDLFVDTRDHERARTGLPALAVAGGSPFNLAFGISRLGAKSGFLGGLSEDGFGRMLAARLEAEGVDISLAKTSKRPTPLAIVATGADGHPTYTFHAENCAECDLTAEDVPFNLDGISAIAIGSFSLIMEPVGTTLVGLVRRSAANCVVSIDPNLRLSLVPDLAHWHARFDGLVRHASIVKLSVEDLDAAYGTDADEAEIAARWLGAGAQLVVTTDGPNGATAYHACGTVNVPGRNVTVIDTVGAGDTFHAAMLASLERSGRLTRDAIDGFDQEGLRTLLTEAAVAAGITCSRRGADLPTLEELRAALAVI